MGCGALLEPFGQQLYGFNKEELNYTDMGKRLGDQRNYFAHGDLDKDFIGLSLLDLIFLQRIIYAMQLKISGLEDALYSTALTDQLQYVLQAEQQNQAGSDFQQGQW